MQYSTYQFKIEAFARKYRKMQGINKKADVCKEALTYFMRNAPRDTMAMEATTFAYEHQVLSAGNHIVFPESPRLMAMLEKARFDIDPASFALPFDYSTIAFPAGVEYHGVKLPGCLVVLDSTAGQKKIIDKFLRFVGEKPIGDDEIPVGDEVHLVTEFSTIGAAGNVLCSIPLSGLTGVLHSFSEFRAYMDKVTIPVSGTSAPTWAEKRTEWAVLHAICALGVYMRAFPAMLKDGFPAQMSDSGGRYLPKFKGAMLGVPEELRGAGGTHESPVMHYRTWYFKSLMAPRFKRGPDGKPRIIYVRDTIVNAAVNPHTASVPVLALAGKG